MICSSCLVETPYRIFSSSLYEQACSSRIPLNGTLELTYRCNCNCSHCYCNLPAADKGVIAEELTTEEVFQLLDQLEEQGCLWLLITGGECLLRPDFTDIWMYAKRKGFLLTLFTNGTLVSPEIANFLKEWPPFSVEVSLYGSSPKIHDSVTKTPGSHDRCLAGIENLLSCGLPVRLKSMVLKENAHELSQMKKIAQDLGVDFRFDAQVNARLNGERKPCYSRLSPKEVVRLDFEDKERWQAWCDFYEKIKDDQDPKLFSCGAGITSFSVNPKGDLQLCGLISDPKVNLRTQSFRRGWQQIPQIREQKPAESFRCNKCESYSLCGQCPGWSMTEHKKLDVRVDYLCQVTGELVKALHKKEKIIHG